MPANRLTHRSLTFGVLSVSLAASGLWFAAAANAQRGVNPIQEHPSYSAAQSQPGGVAGSNNPDRDSIDEERRLRALNAERQKSLVADTNKLLRLVKELNAEIEHSSSDALTPEQLHKVGEIEKLAHNVKERMRTSVRGVSSFPLSMQPLQ